MSDNIKVSFTFKNFFILLKFAEGFKDVKESFYSMSATLQMSEEKLAKSLEREIRLEKEAQNQKNEQQKLLEKYHELKEKYAGIDRMILTLTAWLFTKSFA